MCPTHRVYGFNPYIKQRIAGSSFHISAQHHLLCWTLCSDTSDKMRALLLLLLVAVTAVHETDGFLFGDIIDVGKDIIEAGVNAGKDAIEAGVNAGKDIINTGAGILGGLGQGALNIFNFGANVVGSVINTGVTIGGAAIGAFVDPFGWWSGGTPGGDHGHSTGQVTRCPAVADIIFVLDTSSSMSRREYERETDFAVRLTEHFNIGERDVRVAALTFSDRVYVNFHLGTHTGNAALKQGLINTAYLGGSTKTFLALDYIRVNQLFNVIYGGRATSSKIVVVLTDGYSDNRAATTLAAANLRNTGVKIIAVGIGAGLGSELANIAGDPEYVYSADGFNSLNRIELRVATGICSIPEIEGNIPTGPETDKCRKGFQVNPRKPGTCIDINECQTSSPCQHRCVNLPGAYRCSCKAGSVIDPENANRCKVAPKCPDLVDIIFLVDESGSIGAPKFKLQQQFVAKITHHFLVGDRGARFGGLLFATNVDKLFGLDTYTSRTDITTSLLNAPYGEGGTNTHLGINYIIDNNLFSPANGGRAGAPDYVFVVTDGVSSRPDQTKQAADRLKAQGVKVVAVGIGDQFDPEELAAIASSAGDVFVVAGGFDWLEYIEETITKRICPSTRS